MTGDADAVIILTGSSKPVRLDIVELVEASGGGGCRTLVVRVIAQELLRVLFLPRITH